MDTSDVHIRATKILCEAVKELGGTEPKFEKVSPVEHEVSFKILAKGHCKGMVDIAIRGLSAKGTREDDACEKMARNALQLLQDEHGINIIDYNWFLAEDLRGRCISLVEMFIDSEEIHEFVHTKSFMVLDGIDFASDLFLNKACEVENEVKNGYVHANMSAVLRDCARELTNISQSSVQELHSALGFHTMLQGLTRSKFVKPYPGYVKHKNKVGAVSISCGLKIILDEVASKAGFQLPVLVVDHVIDSGYIGNVQLNLSECASVPNGVACSVQGKLASEQFEAANSAMYHAIGFLSHTQGLNIIDPSSYVLRDLEKVEGAVKRELCWLAQGTSRAERIAHLAINEIHKLADKHDGSISEKDAEIKGVLISMCIDLSRHLDAVYNLIKIAWQRVA